MRLKLALLLLAGVCQQAAMAQLPDRPSLYQSDMVMKNACSKAEQGRLRKEVLALAGGATSQDAWTLASKMLCGRSDAERKYVVDRTANPYKVRDGDGEEGGGKARKAKASSLKVAQMAAWDTSVVFADDAVRVLYNSDEACVASFDLAEVKGKWKIVATGEACD
ncbi:hypothetical protein ABT364_01165 [Massilia sp. SR12]